MEGPTGLVLSQSPSPLGKNHAAAKQLRESLHVALLQGGPILPALFGGLVGDGTIGISDARGTLDNLKHVALAKSEVRYVDGGVAKMRQCGGPVRFIV